MLKVDPSLDHIPAKRGHVMSLFESINQPLVNIPGKGAAPTGAFILGTRNDRGAFTVFVYLYQPESRALLIYVSEPRALGPDQFALEEREAVRFVESMGFMMDDVGFTSLDPTEQEAVMERTPLFRPLGPRQGEARFGAIGGSMPGRPPGPTSSGSWPSEASAGGGTGSLGVGSAGSGAVVTGTGAVVTGTGSIVTGTGSIVPGAGSGMPATGSSVPMTGPGIPATGASSPPGPIPSSAQAGHGPGSGIRGPGLAPPAGSAPGSAPGAGTAGPTDGAGETAGSQPPALGRGLPLPPASPRGASAEQPSDEVRARVGRLLGTFGLLVALTGLGPVGCATSGPPTRAQEAQLDLGSRALADGRWPDALKHFQSVLEERKDDKDAHRGAGLAYWRLGRLGPAERHLRRAVASDPEWSEPKNELAAILTEVGRCAEAETLLLEVLDDIFYPTQHFAEHNLARAEACLGETQSAVDRLSALTERRPKFCLAYLTASEIALEAGRYEATVEACEGFDESCAGDEELAERIPDALRATCDLRKGKAYAALGDVESARAALRRCRGESTTRTACRDALALLPP